MHFGCSSKANEKGKAEIIKQKKIKYHPRSVRAKRNVLGNSILSSLQHEHRGTRLLRTNIYISFSSGVSKGHLNEM